MGTAGRVIKSVFTILSGATISNTLIAWQTYGSSAGIIIQSPAGLAEVVGIQVSYDSGTTWAAYQENGSDITTPVAAKAAPYDRLVLAPAVRLVSTAAVGADRIFGVTYQGLY